MRSPLPGPASDRDRFLLDSSVQPPVPLRVLITRPDEQAAETAELVRARGGAPRVHPCLRLAPPLDPRPLEEALQALARFTWVALASANAARVVAPALAACTPRPLIATVGQRTAEVLTEHGLPVELCARAATAEGLAEELLALLRERGRDLQSERVLLPRADEGREALAAGLSAAGVPVSVVTAYRMLPPPASELAELARLVQSGAIDLAPFGSPRTVEIALAAIGEEAPALLRRVTVGAIGKTTAAALHRHGVQVDAGGDAAAAADFAELLRALAAAHRAKRSAPPADK